MLFCSKFNLTPLQRKYYRRKYSKPIAKRFYRWLREHRAKTLPKSPIGKAIAYALNHWHALNNYRRDGILNIDNNTAERAIKPVVLGRKNYLFGGAMKELKMQPFFTALSKLASCLGSIHSLT